MDGKTEWPRCAVDVVIDRTGSKLAEGYKTLRANLRKEQDNQLLLLRAKHALADARNGIINAHVADTKAMGPNTTTREAFLDERTVAERMLLVALEEKTMTDRAETEISRLDVEEARAFLRLLEVQVAQERA